MDRNAYLNELHNRFAIALPTVIDLAQRATGRDADAITRIVAGDENEVYRLSATDGTSVYIRICFPNRSAAQVNREAWAMDCARSAGVPVPEVLAVETLDTALGQRVAMVVAAAPGRQLKEVLNTAPPRQRMKAMTNLGRTLGTLHSLPLPGYGLPDDLSRWPDAATHHHQLFEKLTVDIGCLTSAGLDRKEVAAIRLRLETLRHRGPRRDIPVMCHGDTGPEHVFIDADLQVCGIIDWGLWFAGGAADDLANVALRYGCADTAAIFAGHGMSSISSSAPSRRTIRDSIMMQCVSEIGWLVTSGQVESVGPFVIALRNVLRELD